MSTGYAWDPGYLGYRTGSHRPENPQRVERLDSRSMTIDLPGLVNVNVDPHLGLPWIRRVHNADYIQKVQQAHSTGRPFLDGGDTLVTQDVFDVAIRSTSGALSLLGALGRGEIDNGFAAIRPPGHHAGPGHAKGFCVFNNVAICARFAQKHLGCQRVLIIDWDVHPADGTSAFFYRDPDVFVLSIHQEGIFGKEVGASDARGRDEGEGTIRNAPIREGTNPVVWLNALERELTEISAACQPDLVLVSCGFDAHIADPVGGMRLDDDDFLRMTTLAQQVANQYCSGRMLSLLEGGYNAAVLPRLVRSHIAQLMT